MTNWWDDAPVVSKEPEQIGWSHSGSSAIEPVQPAASDWWKEAPVVPQARAAEVVKAEYDQMPAYKKVGQAADDVVRLIANGLTFGYADKLAGYAGGEGTDAERARTEEARERAGNAGMVAEYGSAAAVPITAGASGLTLAGRLGTGAMSGVTGLTARSGLMAAEGAGYGALSAAGHDEDIGRGAALGAAAGGAGNVLGEGIAAGLNRVGAAFNPAPAIPTADDLALAAERAYQAADNAGVIYAPQAVDRLRNSVIQHLTDLGYDPALQPGAAAVVRRLDDLTGQNVTLKGLDTLRKVASNGFVPGNRSNNSAVSRIVDHIDDLVANPAAGDVLSGNGPQAAAALSEARDAWSRLAKVGRVENAVERADLRAASTGSGSNADNTTRQNLRRIAEDPRGFTQDETEALLTAVRGTPGQNMLRRVGKLAPSGVVSGGVGSSAGATIGHLVGGVPGSVVGAFAVPALGQAAKSAADRMTRANVDELVDIIMAGGSRAATQSAPNALQRAAVNYQDPLIQAIVGAAAYDAGKSSQGNSLQPSNRGR